MHSSSSSPQAQAFSVDEREAVYRAIFERRDMRHFAGGSVAPEVLLRLLTAAHHAPSVGFMHRQSPIPVRRTHTRRGARRLFAHATVHRQCRDPPGCAHPTRAGA